jgi:uncharacterized membrane protein YdjX (TVP38/TMEM64 family)
MMKKARTIKGLLFIALIFIIVCSHFVFDLSEYFYPEQIREWLSSAGVFAPFLYMGIMALAVIVSPIPSLPLDIAAGAFFGPYFGTLYSVAGALAGAAVSFMIARLIGRELIERFLGGHINFCTHCSDKVLTRIVFMSRFLPVVSFDIVSYGAGLTKMSLKYFLLATFFGMIPLTFAYNYFGSILIFGRGVTFVLGIVMVILFFIMPKWLEGTRMMKKMSHK